LTFVPFSFFVRLEKLADLNCVGRRPTALDFEWIDTEIQKHLRTRHGLDVCRNSAKYLRELVQLYSRVYAEDNRRFQIHANIFPLFSEQSSILPREATRAIHWKEVSDLTDVSAEALGVNIWRSTLTKSDYSSLDRYLQERLQERLGIEVDRQGVYFVRQWALCRHFIYGDAQPIFHSFLNHQKYPLEFEAATGNPVKISKTSVSSCTVVEWIEDWMEERKPLGL